MVVYLNGSFTSVEQARISPMDRGFLFADGAYEVIPAFNGIPFAHEAHLSRLQHSLDALRIPNPHSSTEWTALCDELIERNGGGNIAVYIQVTRGASPARDHGFPTPAVPTTVFMSSSALAESAIYSPDRASGAAAILTDDIRWARCDIKSVALLANVLCRQQAVAAGAAEAIQLRDGLVTEGSSTNVFIVRAGRVATPPRSQKILSGITREIVIELCRKLEIPVEEHEVPREELLQADEVWVTSSSKDALPIVSLDGRPVGTGRPGPVWKAIAREFVELKRAVCGVQE